MRNLISRAWAWVRTVPAKARVLVGAWPSWAAAASATLAIVGAELVPLLPGGWQARAAGYIATALGAIAFISAAVARVTPIVFPTQKGLLARPASPGRGPGNERLVEGPAR